MKKLPYTASSLILHKSKITNWCIITMLLSCKIIRRSNSLIAKSSTPTSFSSSSLFLSRIIQYDRFHSISKSVPFISSCGNDDTNRIYTQSYTSMSSLSSSQANNEFEVEEKSNRNILQKNDAFYAQDITTFESMGVTNTVLVENLSRNDITQPSSIQALSFSKIQNMENIILGAETGSGKSLAYLLPIFNSVLDKVEHDFCRAIILVPNKELAQQVLRMSVELCGGICVYNPAGGSSVRTASDSGKVRCAVLPGGLASPFDFKLFRDSLLTNEPQVDIVIATPATMSAWGTTAKYIDFFATIPTLVIDEADMLLDGGYIQQLNHILLGFRRADKAHRRHELHFDVEEQESTISSSTLTQYVFVAATLPNAGLRSVYAFLEQKFPYAQKLLLNHFHKARHSGLLKETEWVCLEDYPQRIDALVDILKDSTNEKIMIFGNTAADVDQVVSALRKKRVNALPYHAKVPINERNENLNTFRVYHPTISQENPPILVCTDLAARGIDIPKVTLVIQVQFALNVIAHLHRMGRCGRAGVKSGRGIVFYSEEEIDLVKVVQEAEAKQNEMKLEKDVDNEFFDEEDGADGTISKGFSRRRGFRKKIKKERAKLHSNDSF